MEKEEDKRYVKCPLVLKKISIGLKIILNSMCDNRFVIQTIVWYIINVNAHAYSISHKTPASRRFVISLLFSSLLTVFDKQAVFYFVLMV